MSSVISSDEIKARYYHSAKGLINNFCAIMMVENLEGLFVKYIKGAELKAEHQADHSTLLNLNITMEGNIYIWVIWWKRLLFFQLFNIPDIETKIPQIFYSAIKSEFLRISLSTLSLRDFLPKAKELLECMKH